MKLFSRRCTHCSCNYPLSASIAHESRRDRRKQSGQAGSVVSSLCVCLQTDNRGLTWPSPPSSACVVASKGPWSSSWKNQAGSLPPLQVRCGDEKVETEKATITSDKLLFPLKSFFYLYKHIPQFICSSSSMTQSGVKCSCTQFFLEMCLSVLFFITEKVSQQ